MTQYADAKADFLEWVGKFKQKHEGYFPTKLDRWYDRVESNHHGIRKLLGGVRQQHFINLESNQNPITAEEAKPYIQEIKEILPNYLNGYGFSEDVFLRPTIPQGTHSSFKVGKHVRTYAEKNLRDAVTYGDAKSRLVKLDKTLSKLGELWAQARTSKVELEITLSTSARSFVLLGHYGPDVDSCFRNGSDKTNHKFVLGQTPDTFTLSIAKKHKEKDKFVNAARAFGWIPNGSNVINVCNFYLSPGFYEGDALEITKRVAEKILGTKAKHYEDILMIDGTGEPQNGIYNNPYARWTFAAETAKISTQILYPNRDLIQTFNCPACREKHKDDRSWDDVDDRYVCRYCVESSHMCEITAQRTFMDLITIYDENGHDRDVHPNYARKLMQCKGCGIPSLALIDMNSDNICPNCLEKDYDHCDSCGKLVASEVIDDFWNGTICQDCSSKGNLNNEFISI